jgi:hypothetical protein
MKVKKTMMGYLKITPHDGRFVNGKMEDIQFQKVQLTTMPLSLSLK